MAEFLYATSHLAGDFTNPTNANGNTPTTWAGQLNTNSSQTSRWAVGNPVDPLTGSATQTIRVVARKGSNSKNPSITVNLYEGGSLVSEIVANTSITSTSGQTLTGTWTSEDVTNADNVEIQVVMTAQGGSPSTRNSAQISHIEWEADTSAAAKTATGSASLVVSTSTVTQRTAKGTGSGSLITTTANVATQRTAKGTGTASLVVSTSAAGQKAGAKEATGSASLAVTTTATPQRTAKGTGSGSLVVSSTGTPQRTAKGTGSSSLVVTSTTGTQRTAKGTGSSSLAVTTTGTPQRTAKGTGSSSLVFTTSAAGSVAGAAKQATGSASLIMTTSAHGGRESGPNEGPFIWIVWMRSPSGNLFKKVIDNTVSQGGWRAGEGWERVSKPYRVPVKHYMEARVDDRVRNAWAANSGADAATLKAAIEADEDAAGYTYTND